MTNGSFETPVLGANGHSVNPAGAGWVFSAPGNGTGSGIDHGNPYLANNSVPFDGAQQAFLQGANLNDGNPSVDSILQTIGGFTVGQQYRVSFEAEALGGKNGATTYVGDPFSVSLGGSLVSFGGAGNTTVNPSASYEFYTSDLFTATSPTMDLKFFDAGGQLYYHCSLIDSVAVTAVPEPASIVSLIIAALIGSVYCLRFRKG